MFELLSTKLYIPPVRPELVPRPRLIKQLNGALHRKLTLLSAPAGFGKTTIVSEWIADCKRMEPKVPVAWLSLDDGDKTPTRFLTYLVAALQEITARLPSADKFGEDVLGALRSPQPPPNEIILTSLINEIATIPNEFVLVLDDYHVIDAKQVDEALTFLLEHLPSQMHLVIATREDPNLSLSRLRAGGQLTELRAIDLRFTPDEAATFLNQVMGLGLSAEEVASLETRTEGWIAGLQLAAISMRGQEDVHGFIKAFAGDHRYIVDYLVEEVLQHQSECVRRFLLQTSILDRLSGPLCDAVTGQDECNVLLDALERGNLFVYPLDDKRQWFRYHHLFADVLQAHLKDEQPDQIPGLHRRASEWYEQNGLPSHAIRHALTGEDFERAAELVELAWPEMDRSRQSATWLGWAQALPDELVRARPVLSAGFAWALLDNGELEAGETRLRDAESWLDNTAGTNERPVSRLTAMIVVDKDELRFLPASLASARAYIAMAHDDVPGAAKYAQQALDLSPKHDHLSRGVPSSLLGLTSWARGDLDLADRSLADAMLGFQMAGNILFAITGAYVLAEIRAAQGCLHEAFNTYQQYLQLAAGQGDLVLRGTADLYTGLSELYREWDDLEAATNYLLKSKQLGERAALPHWHHRWCIAQARLKQSQGDLDEALDLLDEAEKVYVRGPVPDVRPIAALKARVWIAQGRLSEARSWLRERGLSVDDELCYLGEFEYITLARLLIGQYARDGAESSILEAMRLLERLLKAAQAGGRLGSVIEILALQALAHEMQGNHPLALAALERSLALAEPEGYIRIFIDEGPPMAQLLSTAASPGTMPDYAARLLAAFESQVPMDQEKSLPGETQPLIEPLSERELEVLELIAQGLSNREIGQRLFIALNTVKGHNRKIYGKLQVQRRTEAIARARELGLLSTR